MNSRIIALIDMDCFYCQVECKINPSLHGKPLAVVQYNTWKGGGIIAVNYEARNMGVTRHMRGDEAKQHCPEIELCRVPSVRGKADISKYRNAGREVIAVLSEFSNVVERASIDEAYIDLTDVVHERMKSIGCITGHELSNTFVVGYGPDNNNEDARKAGVSEWLTEVYSDGDSSVLENTEDFLPLAVAGVIVEEIRAAVLSKTQFHCSAGIAHNKILAKLVCGLHKPQKQSILPHCSVPMLYANLSIKKVRNLGGKLGDEVMESLQCSSMIELEKFTLKQLQTHFDEKTASWLYYIARGMDNEPVNARLVSKSIGCCKRFPGKTCLASRTEVAHWIQELADEVCERLEDDLTLNKRRAQLLTVSFTQAVDGKVTSCSRSTPLSSYKLQDVVDISMQVINKTNTAALGVDAWSPPLLFLGLSASKFSPLGCNQSIQQFFKQQDHPVPSSKEEGNQQAEHNSRKPEQVLTHFTKVSPFQLELSKLEKKLVEYFKNYIDSKLESCSSKNVDKVILMDVATEIKSNATANVKKHLKSYCETPENSENQSIVEDTFSIEQKVLELVQTNIEQSLKDINDMLFDKRGEHDENIESVVTNCVPSCSTKPDQLSPDLFDSNTFLNPMKTNESFSSFSPMAMDKHNDTPPNKKRSVSSKHDVSSTLSTLDSIAHPEQNSPKSTREEINKNDSDVITYTRRQVLPENISDTLSDNNIKLKNSSPQLITKAIGSIPIRKYETVEKNHPTAPCNTMPNLFTNTPKKYSVKKDLETNLSNSSRKKERPYSFFENYLRKKKEEESLSLLSVDKHNQLHDPRSDAIQTVNIQDVEKSNGAEKNMSEDINDLHLQDSARSSNDRKKEKPYSFFESYLRRKKEKEKLGLLSVHQKQDQLPEPSVESIKTINIQDVHKSNGIERNMSADTNDLFLHDTQSNKTVCDTEDPNLVANERTEYKLDLDNTKNGVTGEEMFSIDFDPLKNTSNDIESNVKHQSIDENYEDVTSATSISSDPTKITCEKCNLLIDVNETEEHQDYHYALELSTSVETPSPAPSNSSTTGSCSKTLNKKSNKRGRPSKLNSFMKSENLKKIKTIDQFFKPNKSSIS